MDCATLQQLQKEILLLLDVGKISSTAAGNLPHYCAGKREYQQDRHIALPDFKPRHGGDDQVNCCLVGVFDGHKSEQAAELAAAKMPGIIADRKSLYYLCLT